MAERYWRIKVDTSRLWSDASLTDFARQSGKWEPVMVWPVGTVARLREAEAKLALVTSTLRAYMVADVDADADLHEPDKQAWREWIARWEP